MPIRYVAKRIERFFVYRVLHVDDTPHRIALGMAIGIFVTWMPCIGLQMVLTVAISALLGANKLVGVPFVWISNPATLLPIYGPNYYVGSVLLGGDYTWSRFVDAMSKASGFSGTWTAKVHAYWDAFWPIFPPLWLGSVIVASILGVLTYFGILYAVITYRKRRDLHRHHRRTRRGLPVTDDTDST